MVLILESFIILLFFFLLKNYNAQVECLCLFFGGLQFLLKLAITETKDLFFFNDQTCRLLFVAKPLKCNMPHVLLQGVSSPWFIWSNNPVWGFLIIIPVLFVYSFIYYTCNSTINASNRMNKKQGEMFSCRCWGKTSNGGIQEDYLNF